MTLLTTVELDPSDENKVLGEREHSEESETNLAATEI